MPSKGDGRRGRGMLVAAVLVAGALATAPQLALAGPGYKFKFGTLGGAHTRVLAATEDHLIVGDPGAPGEDGRIVHYRRVGSGPTQSWDPLNTDTYRKPGRASFGHAVAIDGDLVVVGAPALDESAGAAAGTVHVYRLSADALHEVAELSPPDPHPGQRFGFSVAVDDGMIAVGSPMVRDASGDPIGAVYLFEPAGAPPVSTWQLRASTRDPASQRGRNGNQFGFDVAIAGATIAAGAPAAPSDQGTIAGAISILGSPGDGRLTEDQRIAGTTAGDLVGYALDLDGDRLLFGIPGRNAAHVYRRSPLFGSAFGFEADLRPPTVTDGLGMAVDLRGKKALVGAPLGDRSGLESGDAFGFRLRGGTWSSYFFPNAGPEVAERAGSSVALAGDRTIFISYGQDRDNFAYGAIGFLDPDFTAPALSFDHPLPPQQTRDDHTTLSFEAADDVTPRDEIVFHCAVNDGPWTPCASPNDVTALPERRNELGVRATDEAGNTSTKSWFITVDQTSPNLSGKASPLPNEHGWNNGPVTVTWTCLDAKQPNGGPGTGISSCSSPVTVQPEGRGLSADGTAVDVVGNSRTARFEGIDVDTTPPGLFAIRPTPNANGWHHDRIWVNYACSDALSGVLSCPQGERFDEGVSRADRTTVDRADNSRTVSFVHNVDVTPPVTEFRSVDPAPNEAGWHRAPVTLRWNCSDALSGPQSPVMSATIDDTAMTDPPVPMRCSDRADNASHAGHAVRIDVDRPYLSVDDPRTEHDGPNTVVPLTGSVKGDVWDGESGVGSVWVEATRLEGLLQLGGARFTLPATIDGMRWEAATESLPPGMYTIIARATDVAGNADQSSGPYFNLQGGDLDDL